MSGKFKVLVSKRALVQCINRAISKEGQMGRKLKATRGDRARIDLGDFYIIDIHRNSIVGHHVDPEEMARQLGALAKWEAVEPDPE